MVDRLENTNIHDILIGRALGISQEELERSDLFQQKNKIQNLAFLYQENKTDITQEEADSFNQKYQEIVSVLENEYDEDLSCDYYINFNSFVPTNSYYHRFTY